MKNVYERNKQLDDELKELQSEVNIRLGKIERLSDEYADVIDEYERHKTIYSHHLRGIQETLKTDHDREVFKVFSDRICQQGVDFNKHGIDDLVSSTWKHSQIEVCTRKLNNFHREIRSSDEKYY